ncbi:hypothetical protein QJS04_geneDACA021516 [Acorus gramineus]|uniref:Uncharacterized protein n=1 Tax=Acorus gramineus TaxID=55184 RepID=A0AAV9A6T7_ACOGR|nr:hypothetical protein QJS04_geneDACA021516 [Acorus gramineus]
MELHARINSAMAKKLWNYVRVAFFMARKGLASKRKLVMDLHLMMKRGKLLKKAFTNLTFHHHHMRSRGLRSRAREHEFSCASTPDFPLRARWIRRHHHHHFPCIAVVDEETDNEAMTPMPAFMIERASSFEEEDEEEIGGGRIDEEAEEFIRRFYEQLRGVALLQYQEEEEEEL